MVTIIDVAKQAGVSSATVSRFLNGAHVRNAQKIEDVIARTGFTRNASASGLRKGRHNSVGIVMPDIANPLLAQIITGAEKVLAGEGIHVLLGNSDENPAREARLIKDLTTRSDGLLIFPVLEQVEQNNPSAPPIPVVLIDRDCAPNNQYSLVTVNNYLGAQMAVDHLVSCGHRKIAIVTGPTSTTPGRQRLEGFLAQMETHHLPVPSHHLIVGDFKETGGGNAAQQIAADPNPPTAIFIANNLMTLGFLRQAKRLGIRIPQDISILGFDDLDLAELITPALTVINRPTIQQGEVAARCLLAHLRNLDSADSTESPQASEHRQVVLPVELIVRDSVKRIS